MVWYNLTDADRIKDVYTKHGLDEFWNWWSDKKQKVMEVRIKDFNLIKETCKKLYVPMSASGVYVRNAKELKSVIAYVRDRATIWFGVNPRKKALNIYDKNKFGGKDVNVSEIAHIFIDIDRVTKDGPATGTDLANADRLANTILSRLGEKEWNKSYVKICSGNGVQLLIKLDIPFVLPPLEFDSETKGYMTNPKFEQYKNLIKKGIGSMIAKFASKYKDELKVEVDTTGMNMGRVAALPVTKNFKHGGFTWRGIVELEDGVNTGLSDYILSFKTNIEEFKSTSVFKSTTPVAEEHKIIPGRMKYHPLFVELCKETFLKGGINNTLWFMLKILLRDAGVLIATGSGGGTIAPQYNVEFRELHNIIKSRHKRDFTTNVPGPNSTFNVTTANNYYIKNLRPPIFQLWPKKNIVEKEYPLFIHNINDMMSNIKDYGTLEEFEHPFDHTKPMMEKLQKIRLGYCDDENIADDKILHILRRQQLADLYDSFLVAFHKKYGDEATTYYVQYVFDTAFNKYSGYEKQQTIESFS